MIPSASLCNLTSYVCCTELGWASDSGMPLHTQKVAELSFGRCVSPESARGPKSWRSGRPLSATPGGRHWEPPNDRSKSGTCDKNGGRFCNCKRLHHQQTSIDNNTDNQQGAVLALLDSKGLRRRIPGVEHPFPNHSVLDQGRAADPSSEGGAIVLAGRCFNAPPSTSHFRH